MKITITCITPVLQAILDFFPDIISFQHVFHLGIGRSQIEWKLKAKTQISVFPWAKIGQNDHSNPYIESTTVLSDRQRCIIYNALVHHVLNVTIADVAQNTCSTCSSSLLCLTFLQLPLSISKIQTSASSVPCLSFPPVTSS